MRIGKSFEMVVSGKYQSYRFATSLEQDYSDTLQYDDVILTSADLQAIAVVLTMKDIDRQAAQDPDFETVWMDRQKSLAQTKYIQNRSNGAKSVVVGERKVQNV